MIIRRLLLPLVCCFVFAHAEFKETANTASSQTSYASGIKEITSMAELLDLIIEILATGNAPLLVFDIDDTLATTEQELGSNAWFMHELETRQAVPGVDKLQVLKEVVALYTHLHNHLPLKAVEAETPDMLAHLQSLGIPCVALTARSLLIERTFKQLLPIGIDFTRCAPSDEDINLSNDPSLPARYTRGIIFNGDNNKGQTLVKYLKAINYKPAYVIYIDDSKGHVKRVFEALQTEGIPCTCLRYGYMDSFAASCDYAKAQKQLEAFLKEHPIK